MSNPQDLVLDALAAVLDAQRKDIANYIRSIEGPSNQLVLENLDLANKIEKGEYR